ncbi:MAG: hypothetical protein QM597_09180, partial [Aeromicrobium sp.]
LPDEILHAIETIGLPATTLYLQPDTGTTLINIPTIYYTHATVFTHTTVLLGHTITITATPTTYTWHHGDGTHHTTNTPGQPWPHPTVTHTYTHPATNLHPRVDTTYHITYTTDDGPTQHLTTPITTPGPPTTLTTTQATPTLTH